MGQILHGSAADLTGLFENRRRHHNTMRPHSSPGYRPLAPEALWPARKLVAQTLD
jgi:hypothetical protein